MPFWNVINERYEASATALRHTLLKGVIAEVNEVEPSEDKGLLQEQAAKLGRGQCNRALLDRLVLNAIHRVQRKLSPG